MAHGPLPAIYSTAAVPANSTRSCYYAPKPSLPKSLLAYACRSICRRVTILAFNKYNQNSLNS